MIKFNLDVCTTRRISGWVFNIDDPSQVVNLRIVACGKSVEIELTERKDVAEAFTLPHARCGLEVNIPDIFDGLVDEYIIAIGDQELFSYQGQIQILKNATGTNPSLQNIENKPEDIVIYGLGRHVVFLYENPNIKGFLDFLSQPKIRRSFPKKIAGCEFSSLTISEIIEHKSDILSNLGNILIVIPSHIYERVYKVSPTIIESGKLITVYPDGSLKSGAQLHEQQINNFVIRKTKDHNLAYKHQSSIIRIWEFIENYSDLVFNKPNNLYFISSKQGEISKLLSYYVSTKIQGKRTEDVIKIEHEGGALVLVNMSAYMFMFDVLGTDECWMKAISRGLRHLDLVI